MQQDEDRKFMQRCLDLAVRAEGMTSPNPMVGALVVHDGKIIGEGYHIKAGGPHAEVIAIGSVTDRSLLKKSVLYVSLEPCSHYGRTPPCTDLIIDTGIPKIVAGTRDTSDKVSGKGFSKLRNAGKEVITGVLDQECRWVNRRFFTFNEKKRPYITLKWAQSFDGYLDTERDVRKGSGPNWITGKPERVLVHKWRSEEGSILVGAETVRMDNPALNVRLWGGSNPLKIILSRSGDLGDYLAGNEPDGTLIVYSGSKDEIKNSRYVVPLQEDKPAAETISADLYGRGIQSLFIEGGARVLSHFIENGFWDEARVFTGSSLFKKGLKAPSVSGTKVSVRDFEASRLEVYINDFK